VNHQPGEHLKILAVLKWRYVEISKILKMFDLEVEYGEYFGDVQDIVKKIFAY
jgi:hypothetical protein